LDATTGEDVCNVSTAPGSWHALVADSYYAPEGDSTRHSPWYYQPNEDLYVPARPLGWQQPDYVPSPDSEWVSAVPQPPFEKPLYIEEAPSPDMLWRPACSIHNLTGSEGVVIDFGQQLNGGVNLSFPGKPGDWPAGWPVKVLLGEELLAVNGSVMVPSRSSVNYTALWRLDASGSPKNLHLTAHQFIQFRYAHVMNSPVTLTPDMAHAWVMQHAGGNPYAEPPCAVSLPFTASSGRGRSRMMMMMMSPTSGGHTRFSSSSAALDDVFRFTAFTAVTAGLDINVDSQTRQRDMCNVDAAITAALQYAVFPAGDYSLQRRTTRDAFTNASGAYDTNFEFKASTTLMAALDAMETGNLTLARSVWGSTVDDRGVNALGEGGLDYVSAQFMAGVRWWNSSGKGLLHIPPATPDPVTNCGGGGGNDPLLGCSPLIDWPTQTRDGYIVNDEDAIRNGISAAAIRGLGDIAEALGDSAAATRYRDMYSAIGAGMLGEMLRDFQVHNGGGGGGGGGNGGTAMEAYFVDGPSSVNASAGSHAAIHSTLYAVAGAGVADVKMGAVGSVPSGGVDGLACRLTSYLTRRDTGGASCMTSRWHLEALYRLAVNCTAASDVALDFLSREAYPSWRFMMSEKGGSATMTLEVCVRVCVCPCVVCVRMVCVC